MQILCAASAVAAPKAATVSGQKRKQSQEKKIQKTKDIQLILAKSDEQSQMTEKQKKTIGTCTRS